VVARRPLRDGKRRARQRTILPWTISGVQRMIRAWIDVDAAAIPKGPVRLVCTRQVVVSGPRGETMLSSVYADVTVCFREECCLVRRGSQDDPPCRLMCGADGSGWGLLFFATVTCVRRF
jgi:hypothetical protein